MALTPELRGTGKLTRFGLGLQVALAVVLAFGAASLLGWLAAQPGLRQRVDLTQTSSNTLDPALSGILDQLPDDTQVRFDVFFRPLDQPLYELSIDVLMRSHHLLVLMREGWGHKIDVVNHDLDDQSKQAQIHARRVELGVRELPVLVVSSGSRKVVLNVYGDLAEFDLGNPGGGQGPYIPPRILRFRAEEAITRAILRVTQGTRPLVVFSEGHGESKLYDTEAEGLGRLHSALLEDGFEAQWWSPAEVGDLPENAAVLAIVAPTEPFNEQVLEWIRAFLDRGGRVLAVPPAPTPPGRGNLRVLLEDYGVTLGDGMVMNPVPGVGGRPTDGVQEVMGLTISAGQMDASHPVTAPLRRADRRVRAALSGHLQRHRPKSGEAAGTDERPVPPRGAVIESLLASSNFSWADQWRVQGMAGTYDFTWQNEPAPGVEPEPAGPFALAMSVAFSPPKPGYAPGGAVPERPESRLVVLAAPSMAANAYFDTNRDLLINAFNWLASREFRVSISARDAESRRLDLTVPGRTSWIQGVVVIGLPLLCLLAGLFTFRVRRR